MAMDNPPFMDDFPIKASILRDSMVLCLMIQDVALWLSKVGDEKEMEWFRQRFPHVRPEKFDQIEWIFEMRFLFDSMPPTCHRCFISA